MFFVTGALTFFHSYFRRPHCSWPLFIFGLDSLLICPHNVVKLGHGNGKSKAKFSRPSDDVDDTSLFFSSKSIHLMNECVNEDLRYLKSWLNANKLSLNVTKTQSLVIGGRKRLNDIEKVGRVKPLFNVGEETVSIIKEAKYLGVMVDQYFNWKEQITAIKKKVSRGIGMLKYSKRYLPLLTIQSMYKSLVEPYFRYCCPVWGGCCSTAINELQKLQSRDATIVMMLLQSLSLRNLDGTLLMKLFKWRL